MIGLTQAQTKTINELMNTEQLIESRLNFETNEQLVVGNELIRH